MKKEVIIALDFPTLEKTLEFLDNKDKYKSYEEYLEKNNIEY